MGLDASRDQDALDRQGGGLRDQDWDRLTRFVDDARIPLDNNATERSILVGRKNHYGSRSRSGTEVASRLYTILETCKPNGGDSAAYLHAAAIAADRGELPLPRNFADAAK